MEGEERERERRGMEERFGKEGRGCVCIETVPRRDNSNGVVKIERGRGIRGNRGERER